MGVGGLNSNISKEEGQNLLVLMGIISLLICLCRITCLLVWYKKDTPKYYVMSNEN